ncbi:MAG TPA: hypothetical protein VMY37_11495 [Thermoguttaceae bacterium]|nr:hypothetical protein [Thermoguttaceae bacterium]
MASRNELLASYKKSATKRGHYWMLSGDEFVELVAGNCYYCGTAPAQVRKPNAQVNGPFVYNGIDRIDGRSGYAIDNCVSCCWVCNRAKGALASHEFEAWISRLVAFQSARFERGE